MHARRLARTLQQLGLWLCLLLSATQATAACDFTRWQAAVDGGNMVYTAMGKDPRFPCSTACLPGRSSGTVWRARWRPPATAPSFRICRVTARAPDSRCRITAWKPRPTCCIN